MYIILYIYIYICIHVDLSGKLYLSFQHLKCWHRRNKPWLIDTGGSGGCLKILTSIATRDLLKYVALDDWMMGKSTRKRNTFCLGAKTLFSGWLLQGFPSINLWNATSMLCNWLYIYTYLDEVYRPQYDITGRMIYKRSSPNGLISGSFKSVNYCIIFQPYIIIYIYIPLYHTKIPLISS